MSFLSDKYAAEVAKKPGSVEYNTFTEHGLGDKMKREPKKPDHSAENEVKQLNKRFKRINANIYAVCKDDGKIGYRKVKPSCDPEHPNVVYSTKKVAEAVLDEEKKEEKEEKEEKAEKKTKKPAEKPSKKQDKPEPKKEEEDRDAKSAKILELIEAKFNKILESKG